MRHIQATFKKFGPWVTGFNIEGEWRGGAFRAAQDERLAKFLDMFPRPGRVLELGCLEGGHSIPIARAADEVVAIDSRAANLKRARWIAELSQTTNVRFVEANLESFDIGALGRFDVIFNVGLLYHLPDPGALLSKLARLSDEMFLWTHVAPEDAPTIERNGYRGVLYQEHGHKDPLSGMSSWSFWPCLEELERMLADAGFGEFTLLDEDCRHPHGPAILAVCRAVAAKSNASRHEVTSHHAK